MNNIKIYPSSENDIIDIYNLSSLYMKNSWSLTSFKEDFNNMFSKYYSLIYEDILVGFISIWIIVDEVTITNICIHKDYQGKGLSNYLMEYLINNFGGFNIFLEVRESNIKALNLYKKFGFKSISIRKNYYKNPQENAIIMKKF